MLAEKHGPLLYSRSLTVCFRSHIFWILFYKLYLSTSIRQANEQEASSFPNSVRP